MPGLNSVGFSYDYMYLSWSYQLVAHMKIASKYGTHSLELNFVTLCFWPPVILGLSLMLTDAAGRPSKDAY